MERAIPEILEGVAVEVVGAGPGDQIDLAARPGAVLGAIEHGVHAEFGDRVLGNLKARHGFRGLFLNAGGVDPVHHVVVVVAPATGETDGPLLSASSVKGS